MILHALPRKGLWLLTAALAAFVAPVGGRYALSAGRTKVGLAFLLALVVRFGGAMLAFGIMGGDIGS